MKKLFKVTRDEYGYIMGTNGIMASIISQVLDMLPEPVVLEGVEICRCTYQGEERCCHEDCKTCPPMKEGKSNETQKELEGLIGSFYGMNVKLNPLVPKDEIWISTEKSGVKIKIPKSKKI